METLADIWLWIQFLVPYVFNILLIVYLWYTNARMRKLEKKIAPFELLIKRAVEFQLFVIQIKKILRQRIDFLLAVEK